MTNKQELNNFFVSCFNHILRAEENALEAITNGTLTIKEIHLIETVFKLQEKNENRFSTIANYLGITDGTMTNAFSKLEKKGYLTKQQDKNDKRVFYIIPTRLAELINMEHLTFHERMIDKVIERLSDKQADKLVAALKALDAFLEEYRHTCRED